MTESVDNTDPTLLARENFEGPDYGAIAHNGEFNLYNVSCDLFLRINVLESQVDHVGVHRVYGSE